ncbi:hypothetical protein ACFFX0_19335 [Citricoccus parietis]|uniref:Uncharacterized protein n=1 Tax=Citricoccus parietis TaxID=592307 RepID=A0ABV5G2R6_9MICC
MEPAVEVEAGHDLAGLRVTEIADAHGIVHRPAVLAGDPQVHEAAVQQLPPAKALQGTPVARFHTLGQAIPPPVLEHALPSSGAGPASC